MRGWPTLLVLLLAGWPVLGQAQGISARFGPTLATVGADVSCQIEVDDPNAVIHRVVIELGSADRERWQLVVAEKKGEGSPAWWQGTFTSTAVWGNGSAGLRPPELLLLRAHLYGRRGGLILSLGELEPLEVEVLTPAESAIRARALAGPEQEDEGLRLTGYAGVEGRAGSSARARGFIGAGGSLSARTELLFFVSIGPAFAVPADLSGGGPLVLGLESTLRFFSRSPGQGEPTLFVEPFLTADLRFPGLDPGAGLRAGLQWPLGSSLELELALGGALLLFHGVESGRDPDPGVAGGLRTALRFGGERKRADEP